MKRKIRKPKIIKLSTEAQKEAKAFLMKMFLSWARMLATSKPEEAEEWEEVDYNKISRNEKGAKQT